MKTIGVVLPDFPVLTETFTGTEMRAMQDLGHKVVPISLSVKNAGNASTGQLSPCQPQDVELSQNTLNSNSIPLSTCLRRLCAAPQNWLQFYRFASEQQGFSLLALLRQSLQIVDLIKQHRIDHLHAHFALHSAALAIAAARLAGITVSFVGHGFDIYRTPQDLAVKCLHADFSVAVCHEMKQLFQLLEKSERPKLTPSINTRPVHYVPCGIELKRFTYQAKPCGNGKLLFIGRLTEKKGLKTLIRALARLRLDGKSFAIDIVGNGPLKQELIRLVEEVQLSNIEFLGAKDSDWIATHAPYYTALVAPFCEAADGDRDTGPLVLKEAMALGLPVVTTSFMGCTEIVGNEGGFLVPQESECELAKAIKAIFQLGPAQRLRLCWIARQRVTKFFSADTSAKKLSAIIENLGRPMTECDHPKQKEIPQAQVGMSL